MGQAFGIPQVNTGMRPFCNLPKEAMQSLWTSYNLLGEGWGLSFAEFKSIFNGAAYLMKMGFSDDHLLDLFNAFDTDANGLVDALEMLITLALASGMDTVDKIFFIFAIYDFNNASILSCDECTLMLRSVTKGIVKLYPSQAPGFLANTDGDIFAGLIFANAESSTSVSNKQFMQYCISHPIISSWLSFSSNIPPAIKATTTVDAADMKVTDLCAFVPEAKYAMEPLAQAECLPYIPPVVEEPVQDSSEEAKGEEGAAEGVAASVPEPEPVVPSTTEEPPEGAEGEDTSAVPVAAAQREKMDPRTPWSWTADDLAPEEVPTFRTDNPEDSFELMWVHGNSASSGLRNSASYASGGQVVFTASRLAIAMSKGGEEAPVWSQRLMSEHQYPITCMSVDGSGKFLATADRIDPSCAPLNGKAADSSRVVLSSLVNGSVLGSIPVSSASGSGVRLLSFSANSRLLLAVFADTKNTVGIYDTMTFEAIYLAELGETALDVTFCGTDAIFATTSEDGVFFYVDEGNKFLSSTAFRKYERRTGLLHSVGKDAAGVAGTAICRFEHPDETISANVSGQLLFWHGRNCIQLISAHRGAVTCLSYNPSKKVLASAGKDGTISLFKLTATSAATVVARKGPKIPQVRELEMVGSFDMMLIFVPSRRVASLSLHEGGERVLVGTTSGDLLELSLVPTMPEGSEESQPPAEGTEGDAPVPETTIKMPRLGNDLNGGPIVSCHWSGAAAILPKPMVWGLCKTPGGFVSVGSDGLICLWSSAEGAPQKLIKKAECDSGLRGVTVSATALAVSMDGAVLPSRLGTIQIFSFPDLVFLTEFKTAAKVMSLVRFSPDGATLVCGGSDAVIYFYSQVVPEGSADGVAVWTLKGTISSPAGVLALDFTADGAAIRVVDSKDNLAIYDAAINIGAPITSAEILRTFAWATFTCPCCWDTKGAFKGLIPLREGEDCDNFGPGMVEQLGAVDRSQHLFINAGVSGVMSITRVPADADLTTDFPVGKASLPIHCGRVSAVCFIEEGTRLVTAGADDGIIQVWKVNYELEEPEVEAPPAEGEEAPPVEEDPEASKKKVVTDSAEEEDLFDGKEMTRHLSVKPPVDNELEAISNWIGSVDLSLENMGSMERKSKDRLVTDELQMEWIYGYSARSTRGAVRYNNEGKIVYPAGCVGVILDKAVAVGGSMAQSYFMGHCDEITCMDVHGPTGIVASGQKGTGDIIVCIWSSITSETLQRLNCGPVLGVSAVTFSPHGKSVAIACQDENHTVLIYEWKTAQLQASYKGGLRKILSLNFSLANSSNPDSMRLLQSGLGHFQLIDIKNGRTVIKKSGVFGGKKLNVLCAAALPVPAEGGIEFVCGLSDGSIGAIARGERKFSAMTPIWPDRDAMITAITVVVLKQAEGDAPPIFRVVVGGKNREIRVLDGEFAISAEFLLNKPEYGLLEQGGARGFKSLSIDKANRKILYGTSAGEIGEIDFEKGLDINTGPLVQSHFKDELHAMTTHPIRQEMATAGDDKILRVWNMDTKVLMGQIMLPDICRAVCFAPNGHIIICGLGGKVPQNSKKSRPDPRDFDGKVAIVSFLQNVLQIVHIAADAFEAISTIVYAPDGSKVYVGSMDSNIYVYDALDNFKLWMTLKMHSEGVSTLDITDDGKILVSTSIAGEVMIWDTETLEEKAAPIVPDIARLQYAKWYVRQGTRNFNSTGIFSPFSRSNDVLSLSQSKDDRLFATGDVCGSIRLLRNPSIKLGANHKRYVAHTPGGVSKLSFSIQDKYMVSIGKKDRCIVQWKLVKSAAEPELALKEYEPPREMAQVAGAESLGPFSESFVIDGTSLLTEQTPSSSEKSTADATKVAETIGVDRMSGPSSCYYIGVGCVAETAESFEGLTGPIQLKRPYATYSGQGNIVTLCGKRVVSNSMDRLDQTTWSHTGNSGEVGAIAITACSRFLLVGSTCSFQIPAGSPEKLSFVGSLSVLNASSGNIISVLSESIVGGANVAEFSHDGKTIVCVGGDNRHMMYIYASCSGLWHDAILLYKGESSVLNVTALAFMSGDSSCPSFVTGGASSTKFWTIRGRNVSCETSEETVSEERQALGKGPVPVTTMVGIPGTGEVLVGNEEGQIALWAQGVKTILASHSGPVTALSVYFKSGVAAGFTSGAQDDIKVWELKAGVAIMPYSLPVQSLYAASANYEAIKRMLQFVGGDTIYPTAISPDSLGQRMLVSLSCNAVVELSVDSGSVLNITEGQLKVKTTSICPHPSEPQTMVSVQSNNTVKVWDLSYQSRECVGALFLTHQPDGLCFLTDSIIAVGISNGDTGGMSGGILFLELSPAVPAGEGRIQRGLYRTLKVINKFHNVGKGAINVLKVSPDGKYLCAGSDDGNVYLFSADTTGKQLGEIKVSPGIKVMALDFSTNSRYLRVFGPAASGDAVIKASYFDFVDIDEDELVSAVKQDDCVRLLRTVSWNSCSSPAAVEARGSHPASTAGIGAAPGDPPFDSSKTLPQVTCVCAKGEIIAAGYSNGITQLFRSPAAPDSGYVIDNGHSAGAVKCTFLTSGQLVTVGEQDGTIMVWKL